MSDKQNKKDLPRGLQIDTTTGEGANITKEKIMVPKKKPTKAFMGLGVEIMKKAKKKGAKGAELLSPLAMARRFFDDGGEVEIKKGGDYIKDLIK
jgi:hypothetical protein|tara:strand:+ start:190 stop:474 length:285 start_codon:yes stop_codon:yes gene_type:complete